ncbi:2-oxoglutarate oxidoreductase [Heliobacterium gestii]|uniref:2-oxoglutarate oxidoreductase n=1 Tax=Heliomicrobium gestii TaxID=2699 RepID=A0A845LF43_HELGE|nr:thiamine pyrophosphate-dependent enzyme [Heliomicrobium gestii]MBM7865198.1 2-oxoglutarate ferredoxin oxidoreductase subunit beta [Heliomicrobium gestii]MZP41466.1 2-oxoglutarate oxidoreductase [Heliomicrobium gestii]
MGTKLFSRPDCLRDVPTHYCPGCHHGIIHRLVAEAIDELELASRTIGVAPVGCSVFIYDYIDTDFIQASHGRAPAVATGVKRALPDRIVFTYQGDGDLAAIGTSEIIHTAARGENVTVIFVNNAIYGMTGGQSAPTTLPGQSTTTTPNGRDIVADGAPIQVCEMLNTLQRPALISRVSVHTPAQLARAKKAIRRAFRCQQEGRGFSFVEVLSACPTNWAMTPLAANQWLEQQMLPYYPIKDFRKPEGVQ